MEAEPGGPIPLFASEGSGSDSKHSVPSRVAHQARRAPKALAIKDGAALLCYGDLAARSRELADHLHRRGVNQSDVVGICAKRSIVSIVAALGIMEAGAAYLPLDPSHPEERLASQFRDGGGRFLVTSGKSLEAIAGKAEQIALDERGRLPAGEHPSDRFTGEVSPAGLAYVIYTSGSTGEPKGVEITHANLLNLVDWHEKTFDVTESDRASHLAAVSFDAAVWEIWPYLTAGASVHVANDAVLQGPEALRNWLLREKITFSFVPTMLAEQLIDLEWPSASPLRFLLTGGDVLRSYPPRRIPFPVVNNYGPTECSVVATSIIVKSSDSSPQLPTIGKAIANVNVYILDETGRPVGIGKTGEIWIAGRGVARGYRYSPELTAERFRMLAGQNGKPQRAYRTGDRGRVLPDGQIQFLGRIDEQIKIRGFRVEPGEVEARLKEHRYLRDCAVVAIEELPGDKTLIAYLVPRSQLDFQLDEVRAFLAQRLPDPMIPGKYVVLESMPLTRNGKIDRAALRAMAPGATHSDGHCSLPSTPTEARVAAIVAPLLKLERVRVWDNFFLLGGHSLLGTQLIARVRKAFAVDVSLRYIFEHPTISEIASEVDRLRRVRQEVALLSENAGEFSDKARAATEGV